MMCVSLRFLRGLDTRLMNTVGCEVRGTYHPCYPCATHGFRRFFYERLIMSQKKIIVVCYTLTLDEKDFDKVLKEAKEFGCDYADAGPILTVRRFLETEGMSGVEEVVHGPLVECIFTDEEYIKASQKL